MYALVALQVGYVIGLPICVPYVIMCYIPNGVSVTIVSCIYLDATGKVHMSER